MPRQQNASRSADPADKIAALQEAMAAIEQGEAGLGTLFDEQAEKVQAKVRAKALRLLDHRARSRAELRERLLDEETPAEVVDAVLDDFESSRLIDDENFAREWVRQRRDRRGKSTKALDIELKKKGVDTRIRADVLADIDDEDEATLAEKFAIKKAQSIKTPPADYNERMKALRRIVGVLARRGFSEGVSMFVARAALDSRIEELEEEGA